MTGRILVGHQMSPFLLVMTRFCSSKEERKPQCFTKVQSHTTIDLETKTELFGHIYNRCVRRNQGGVFKTGKHWTAKHGGGSIMLWACLGTSGIGTLYKEE
ncbi:hypothetical protein ATANTOWER_020946 [Ataeniobius toweri]|uniref:Secreted protein n=1 Tax=Ataeniobius toweri TaxID=208326 RepID=A0ABU7BUA8_9TELE|nr:hypothetical protein [Ataeniobius toweri]